MTFHDLATFAAAMLTILNPIGNTALFAGIVSDRSEGERRAIAWKCTTAVAIILVGSIWLGEPILQVFGVSVASLEAAGGLVIALIAVSMLHSRRSLLPVRRANYADSGRCRRQYRHQIHGFDPAGYGRRNARQRG